ncbi:hypothetical protein [Tenacibaculum ovolyticum]|uniref:hypothetical protein n=1 Tax=Tenacibaculum ovolyticum TaxID=104270 RepID=UPI001F3558FA|nr:hypothetical protein [Tenacibaculum ovolyticum]
MDKIIKTLFNSYALTGFFAVFGLWLFFKKKENKSTNLVYVDYSGTSLTDVQAKSYAQICLWAVGDLGTDEDTLYNTLLPLSNQSFNHVYSMFGYQKEKTLVQWLVSELSISELEPFRKFELIP